MKDSENSREAGKVALSSFQIQKHLCDPLVTKHRYFQRTVTDKFAALFKSQIPDAVSQLHAFKHLSYHTSPDSRNQSQHNGTHHEDIPQNPWRR